MELEESDIQSKIILVPCLKWVKRGVAKENPDKVQLSKDELVQIIKDTKAKIDENGQGESSTRNEDGMNVEEEFNMESYDADNDEATGVEQLGIHSIAELNTNAEENFEDDDDSDKEDDLIKTNDNLLLIGKVDGDASILEVYVYNENEGSFYCHHDLFLSSFPLCLEWLDCEPNQPAGNYCAVGYMTPIIEVWDMDVVNCMEPAYCLGSKASKKKKTKQVGHHDAVLGLAWNRNYHHIMASASADNTVLLWDIENGIPSTTIDKFNDKVQCVQWNPTDGHTLLAGDFDSKAHIFDCRNAEEHKIFSINGDAESMHWSTSSSHTFFVGTSEGTLHCFDSRQGELWSTHAHNKEVTGLSTSALCPGLLVSISADETVKIWDVEGDKQAELVHDQDFKMQALHCLEFCPDLPFVFAAGGSNKSKHMRVFDSFTLDTVKHRFGNRPLLSTVKQENEEMEN